MYSKNPNVTHLAKDIFLGHPVYLFYSVAAKIYFLFFFQSFDWMNKLWSDLFSGISQLSQEEDGVSVDHKVIDDQDFGSGRSHTRIFFPKNKSPCHKGSPQ